MNQSDILIITPTVQRAGRIHFIKECIKTFRLVSHIRWIVVEDGHAIDPKIKNLLEESGIPYDYLYIYSYDFGNAQKNLGLTYIRDNHFKGVIYLADDDNRYDVRLFEEIRKTNKISIFPVGNLGPTGIERPIVRDGKIVGWDASWDFRKFPVDQAGYAVNADVLEFLPEPLWAPPQPSGETDFIEKIIQSRDELELLCNDCQECYVWHNDRRFIWPFRKFLYKFNSILERNLKTRISIKSDSSNKSYRHERH